VVVTPAALDMLAPYDATPQPVTLRLTPGATGERRIRIVLATGDTNMPPPFALVNERGNPLPTMWAELVLSRAAPSATVHVAWANTGAAAAVDYCTLVVAEGGRELLRMPLRAARVDSMALVLAASPAGLRVCASRTAALDADADAARTVLCVNKGPGRVYMRVRVRPLDDATQVHRVGNGPQSKSVGVLTRYILGLLKFRVAEPRAELDPRDRY